MRILILGDSGMLGHMVKRYLNFNTDYEIHTIKEARFPSPDFKNLILNDYDYIINCIGSIPQRTKDYTLNYELPIWLEQNINTRIIHPGTDCEADNDEYGISKKRARDFIVDEGTHTKIIKTSIIGPELNGNYSLMDWFLSQEDEVGGYTNIMWNGNTTLEWAKNCLNLINNWNEYPVESILEGTCVSKFDLLHYISEVFEKQITINPNGAVVADKCLKGHIKTPHIKDQLKELKLYYGN